MTDAAGSRCPDENELTRLIEGRLSGVALARLEDHVDGCAACASLLADLALVLSPAGGAGAAEGPRGRFRILGELGGGAHGVVHEALDRKLGRRVALKRLRPDLSIVAPDRAADACARLLREARSLAAVAHPNVVSLFDVGADGEEVVLVEELIEGRPVDVWLATESPAPREIVAAFAQAARGLHAAHVAGLVHRDVKPSNLLLGRDGRVRVTDFGLALALGGDDAKGGRLTRSGAAVGTPAYMAPEQLAGRQVDARADQFSLAVALAEALIGDRPLPGSTAGDLEAAATQGGRALDRAVLEALARALAARAADRWDDLAAFEAALTATEPRIDPRAGPPKPPAGAASDAPSRASSHGRRAIFAALLGGGVLAGYAALREAPVPLPAAGPSTSPAAPAPPSAGHERAAPSASAGAPAAAPSASAGAPATEPPPPAASPASSRAAAAIHPGNLADTARRRRDSGDAPGCVSAFRELAKRDAAFASRAGLQKERAECEMLAGQCDAGRERMRALLRASYSGDELERAVDATAAGSCRRAAADQTVTLDQARGLVTEGTEAWRQGDATRCRAVASRAMELARLGQPAGVSGQLASALGVATDCLSKSGDCATARKAFVAMYAKLHPQLTALGVHDAQRERLFLSSYPRCASKP